MAGAADPSSYSKISANLLARRANHPAGGAHSSNWLPGGAGTSVRPCGERTQDRERGQEGKPSQPPECRQHARTRLYRSPWQNGVAERWVGSCRRDLLDHVIVLNERHLKRLISEYVLYYHGDRTHLGLAKDTPARRPTTIRSRAESKIQSFTRLGGLHHRYAVAA